MNPRLLFVAASTTLALVAGCATTPSTTNVADTIAGAPQLSTLNKLVKDAGLADTLRSAGPYTVFAPTDEAFKAVPAATMSALGSDKERLKAVLMYHVVPGKVAAADIKNGPAKTAQGANVALARSGTFVTVDDAVVPSADLAATNGVVHIVDRVLLPPR